MPVNRIKSDAATSLMRSEAMSKTRIPKNDIGKDEFLKILVAQLSNQDPLQPTSDSEFIGQMAQFSTLEQMQTLNQSYDLQKAQSLMGQYVVGEIPPSTETGGRAVIVDGLVEAVAVEKGVVYLKVNGKKLPISGLQGVLDTSQYSKAMQDMLGSASLIGKHIVAQIVDKEGNTTKITGQVEKIIAKNGWLYAIVGEHEVALDSILEISSEASEPTDGTEPISDASLEQVQQKPGSEGQAENQTQE